MGKVNEVNNEAMIPVLVGENEMKKLVEGLPNWGKEIERMLAKKYKGYKYLRDGVRIDGDFCMMRKEGDRQWFLKYLHYRICGTGKRSRFRSVLKEAYFVDSMGRIGKYRSEDIWERDIKEYGLAFSSCIGLTLMPSSEEDVIGALKYSNLVNKFQEMDGRKPIYYNIWGYPVCYANYGDSINCKKDDNRWEELLMYVAMYIHFPQVEFIYKMKNRELRNYLISKLIDLFEKKEFQELRDRIDIIRLCVKHKFHLFEHNVEEDRYYRGRSYCFERYDWWNYISDIRKLGKDWRNPHYLCPDNISAAESKVRRMLLKKFPEMSLEERIQKKFDKLKRRYIGIVFEEGDLTVMTLDSPKAYIEESNEMHNCIASDRCYLKVNSLILCARLKGKRIADIELSLKDYRIIQCKGPFNKDVPECNRIAALIEKNIPEIQSRQFIRKRKKAI